MTTIGGIDVHVTWSVIRYEAWLEGADSPDDLRGIGFTEQDAIDDLREQLEIGECQMHGEHIDDCPKC